MNYRESYGMHASNGILFNHESPRRGENFVTRKITLSLARIKPACRTALPRQPGRQARLGLRQGLRRDDVADAAAPEPDDYVVATGETHTVREFIERAAPYAGYEIAWEGKGDSEIGRDKKSGKVIVEVDPKFYRPAEVELLLGDPAKAKSKLDGSRKPISPNSSK